MKKTYRIVVDCANCAAKMEHSVQKLSGIREVAVNYITQKMTVVFPDDADEQALRSAITKVCRKVDADFELKG